MWMCAVVFIWKTKGNLERRNAAFLLWGFKVRTALTFSLMANLDVQQYMQSWHSLKTRPSSLVLAIYI